jgi:hypothetical protein
MDYIYNGQYLDVYGYLQNDYPYSYANFENKFQTLDSTRINILVWQL